MVAWLLIPVIAFATLGVSLLFPGIEYSPEQLQQMESQIPMNFPPIGPIWNLLIFGLIWGIWHAPFIFQGHNYPQYPVAGVFMMTI